MNPTIVRSTTESDADILADLGRRTFTQSFGHLYATKDLAAFLAERHNSQVYARLIGDPRCAAWIARDSDEAPIGYATAGPCDLPVPEMPPRSGELQRLYILRSHQGGGLGARMLETVLAWLEGHFDHLYLSVFSENTGAQRLYARFGFEKIHTYNFMVGTKADAEFILARNNSEVR